MIHIAANLPWRSRLHFSMGPERLVPKSFYLSTKLSGAVWGKATLSPWEGHSVLTSGPLGQGCGQVPTG